MVKVFEIEVQVTATLRLAGGGECEYTEAFIVPLNDEFPRDAVLPGFISFTESYQRELRKIPAVIRAAKEHFAREDSATLQG